MEETPLQSRLSLLNYTKEWVDYGLLTEERLKEQTIELQKGKIIIPSIIDIKC